ncbi:class I SAM-dependent methyltransferase [Gordonia sp. (in: high G+C Gram-positive bacteria)]|uniref:class I SAM-dependent methyltransferase n=1 Tax=Gordonia sp. (in: high G+C Gram-positive bacteria) TaxID=84139 RepID=UPI003F9AAFDE
MAPQDATTRGTARTDGYLYDTGTELSLAQVHCVELLLDSVTTDMLTDIISPGARCLEIGAGNGSVARWMTDRVGDDGQVVAIDLDTSHFRDGGEAIVYRHDINDGPPEGGPFDLIHARLVFLHLPRRLEILQELVRSLAPDGWLVLGDFDGTRLPYATAVPRSEDADVFDRVMDIGHRVVGTEAGMSLEWAGEVADHLESMGLVEVQARDHSRTVTGGDVGGRYLHNLITQIFPVLEGAGLAQSEIARTQEILLDPRFSGWFYHFLISRGRKSANLHAP